MPHPPVDTLRALFRSLPLAAILLGPDGRVRSANPACVRLFGITANPNGASTPAQDLFADARAFNRLFEDGFGLRSDRTETQFLARYRTTNGRVFDGETIVSRVTSDNGDAPATLIIIRDVSPELTLKAKLEASDIQLRAALASANEGAFSLNLVTRLGSVRGFINEFLGIQSADATISLERLLEIVEPDMRGGLETAIRDIGENPASPLDSVFRARRADGETRWLHMRGRVTEFNRDGRPLRISGVISDVTDRQALETRLADRERQLASAIDAGSSGVWEISTDNGTIMPIGPIRAMLGLDDDMSPVTYDAWAARIHADDREAAVRKTRDLVSGQRDTFDLEYRLLDARTDSWVWLRSRGRRIADDTGRTLAAGIITDISDRKLLEQRLTDNERLLREALETASDGAWSLDVATRRLRVTGFLARILQLEDPDAVISADRWREQLQPEDLDIAGALHTRLLATPPPRDGQPGPTLSAEFRMTEQDGRTIWVRSRGRVVEWAADGTPLRMAGTVSDISEEHRLESALRRSETRLRDALDAANEGAWRFDLHSRIVEITAVIAEMMGLPRRDTRVTYSDWLDRVHPADLPICKACFDSLSRGDSDTVDYTVRYRSGSNDWIRIHNRGRISDRDADGTPRIATGFITDVSDRMQTEQVLAQRDRQLSEAVEAASIGTWRYDYEADIISFRGSLVAELFGTGTATEVPMARWKTRVHPDDHATLQRVNDGALSGELEHADYEYRLQNHKGEWIWYRNTGAIVDRSPDGHPTAASGVIWNIHSAKQLEADLEARRARFERIYRASPAMMHMIDAEDRIVEVSDFWLSHLGYERSEVIGRRSVDFLDAESRERALATSLPQLFSTGHNSSIPYRFLRKDGSGVDVLLSAFLERDSNGHPLRSYAVSVDVTALREANEKLERTNRELDRFATVASHDLQEPLRKISAFSSLLRRRYGDRLDETGIQQLDFLVDAAQRMQRLIDDLLTYSKLASQPLAPIQVALADILAQVTERLETAIGEAGAIIEAGGLPVVEADPILLTQILQNLVSNAVKYRSGPAPRIHVTAERAGDTWTVSVSDNGIGLDLRFAEKIFAPFQRLHSRDEYHGTGIGLAIVRQAVERQGGKVWVESAPGEGATFRFTLPGQPGDRNLVAADTEAAAQ